MVRSSFVIVVSVIVLAGLVVLGPQAKAGEHTFDLRVLADPSSFDSVPSPDGKGLWFMIFGRICADSTLGATCVTDGGFKCWGVFRNPNSLAGPVMVNQEFTVGGRGKILADGAENAGPRAMTGGTGDFRYARGQITGTDFSSFDTTGEFVVTFALIDVLP